MICRYCVFSTSGSKQAVNLDYSPYLRDAIVIPLAKKGSDGIPASLEVMKNYQLLREDLDSIVELTQWPNRHDPFSTVDSKVKKIIALNYSTSTVLWRGKLKF